LGSIHNKLLLRIQLSKVVRDGGWIYSIHDVASACDNVASISSHHIILSVNNIGLVLTDYQPKQGEKKQTAEIHMEIMIWNLECLVLKGLPFIKSEALSDELSW
jgi:hypothetical protein